MASSGRRLCHHELDMPSVNRPLGRGSALWIRQPRDRRRRSRPHSRLRDHPRRHIHRHQLVRGFRRLLVRRHGLRWNLHLAGQCGRRQRHSQDRPRKWSDSRFDTELSLGQRFAARPGLQLQRRHLLHRWLERRRHLQDQGRKLGQPRRGNRALEHGRRLHRRSGLPPCGERPRCQLQRAIAGLPSRRIKPRHCRAVPDPRRNGRRGLRVR